MDPKERTDRPARRGHFPSRSPRPTCARCRRPVATCYCSALTTLDTTTRVVILQHPRERDMPIGTARMASLCLPRSRLLVGVEWDDDPTLRAALGDPERPPILLWPGPGARDVLRDPPAGPVTLVVVDGTWSQAKSIVRRNPGLAALPRYAFDAPEPTTYRIRREPRNEYVSTIEALMHVLGVLEADPPRFRALLEPMRAMIDAHLAQQAECRRARARKPRPPRDAAPRPPALVAERFDDLVCVVAESNPRRCATATRGFRHELVHWVARRVSTGETFDAVIAPRTALSPVVPERIGLDEERLRRGATLADVVAEFARFLRPTDVICAWGPFSPRLFRESGGTLPEAALDLREVARRRTGRKVGSLEQFAAEAVSRSPPDRASLPDGRAGLRLGMLAAVATTFRAG